MGTPSPGMTQDDRFEAFVREYQDLVFATAVRLVGRAGEAEDVAQTVFLRAFEHFDALDGAPSAAGWLKTVTTNLCLNHLTRYRARWQFFSEIEPSGGESVDFASTIAAPDVELDREPFPAGQLETLECALRTLPDHQRVPIVLFHFEERSYDEIARTLGVSLGKVKTDIHRGRLALRRVLARIDAPA